MSTARTVARNSVFLGLTNGLVLAVQLLFVALLTRYQRAEGFGAFTMVLAVVAFCESTMRGSASTIVTRDVARSRQECAALFWPGALLQVAGGLAVIGMSVLALRLYTHDPLLRLAGLVGAGAASARLAGDLPVALWRGMDAMHWETVVTVCERGLFMCLFLAVLRYNLGFVAVFAAGLVSQWIVAVASLAVTWWSLRPPTRIDWARAKDVATKALPLVAFGLLVGLHWRMDTLMLGRFGTRAEVGVFGAAFKLIETFRMLPWLLLMAAFPALSRLAQENRQALARSYTMTLRVVVLAGLPATLLLAGMAGTVAKVMFPAEFGGSATVLRILSLTIVPLSLNWVVNYMCLCLNQQGLIPRMYLVASVIHLVAGLVLVPTIGVTGAAISFLAGEGALCAVGLTAMAKHLCPASAGALGRPAVAALAGYAMLVAMKGHGPLVATGLAVATYAAAAAVTRALTHSDLMAAAAMVRSNGRS